MLELVASQPWLRLKGELANASSIEDLGLVWVMTTSRDDAYFGSDKFRSSV
jgi:hypothetical protein